MDTFYSYRGFRWFWVNLALVLVMSLVYLLDSPIGGPSGSTFVGYTYGGIALFGMLILMWYGIRKRAYRAAKTTLRGSLALHVWLGVALIFIVPLHAGFRFGMNVHTLAYVLMAIVIVSGIWGAMNYAALAPQIGSHRGEGTIKAFLQQLDGFSSELTTLMRTKSDAFLRLCKEIDFQFSPTIWSTVFGTKRSQIEKSKAAALVADLPSTEREDALKLISVVNKKRELASRVFDEVRVKFWLRAWLYFHLPVSIALCLTVAIHIVSVLYYH